MVPSRWGQEVNNTGEAFEAKGIYDSFEARTLTCFCNLLVFIINVDPYQKWNLLDCGLSRQWWVAFMSRKGRKKSFLIIIK